MPRGVRSISAGLAALAAALLALPVLAAADPYRSQQWGLERVRAPQAWQVTTGQGVVIAIVDTGVDLDHPDLVDRLARGPDGRVLGRDVIDGDDEPRDHNGHGTMVAGVAAATAGNGEGVAGVAPGARIMPVRVLDAEGGGTMRDLDQGIRWAADNGADVINLSLESVIEVGAGGVGARLGAGGAPTDAVRYAWDRGVVVVAAAGNSGHPFTDYPPDAPVLLVGATDRDDRRAGFSDAGRNDAVMAPGVGIVSTWCRPTGGDRCDPDQRYGVADGTSFAAPHVSGIAAMLRAQGLDHETTAARIRQTARDLGTPGPDPQTGHGLVNAAAAVGAPPPPPPPSPSPSPSAPPAPVVTPADRQGPSPATTGPGTPPPETPRPEPTASPTEVLISPAPVPTPPALAQPDPGRSEGRTVLLVAAALLLAVTATAVIEELARWVKSRR